MAELLIRCGGIVAVIALGYILKRVGFFRIDDFHLLSKLVLHLTLPASIVLSCATKRIEPSMLVIAPLGLLCGLVFMGVAMLINVRSTREKRAFEVLNYPGLGIGNFALPFVQSFIGPTAVITTSLLDIGNAVICLGAAHGAAATIMEGTGFSLKRIGQALIHSLAFDVYIIMVVINLLRIPIPTGITSFAEILANGNMFLAMLMIGVGFSPTRDVQRVGYVVKFLAIRYAVAAVLAVAMYYLLPFQLAVRQTLALLMFSPMTSTAPVFTARLDGNVEMASTLNSISMLSSIVIMVVLLTILY